MSLKHRTLSAVRWTTTAAVVRTLLQLAQVAVLARLLTPDDYGLMAMVTVVLGFASLFADLGMNSAYMQRQDVTSEQRSSLFWLNVGMSVLLAVLLVMASPFIAGYFNDNRLTPLLMLSASTVVIGALGQQVRMAAEKALDFRPVIQLEIGAALLGFIAAVITASAGWGVYSLIVGSIVGAASSSSFAWLFLARGWAPMWRCRFSDVRSYLGFGSALVANNVINQINMSIDLLLGGRLLVAAQLGFYSMPRSLVLQLQFMVNPIVTRVGFPLIAQVQCDLPMVRAIYLKTLNMTASVNAPLYVGIAFFAPELILIMLGDKWLSAVDLLRLLAVWGYLRSIGNLVGSLLLGLGRADLSLKWNLGLLCVVPPVLWAGSQFGSLGLAWALLGLSVTLFLPGWFVLVRPLCHTKLLEYSVAAIRPFCVAAISMVPAYWLLMHFDNVYLRLAIAFIVSTPLYLVLSYFANRGWVIAMVSLVLPGKVKVPDYP
ncbi:MOP flippase family protein [Marinobacterium aestuariivivens]|uniref:MOP flippase family protein n=1 Tax=Marinobacterium aestuariivivens TaxID=1698799 RepID=A0ABW1ZX04_9GAMM